MTMSIIGALQTQLVDCWLVLVKYESKPGTLNDNFCHLTNFSINKNSKTYIENNDIKAAQGHKW